jgi:uncharacterized protein
MTSHAAELETFLHDPARAPQTLQYTELQGFLFAVVNAPEVIVPSEWLPVVFGGETPEFKGPAELGVIHTALMDEYNAVSAATAAKQLPPGCVLREDVLANLEDDAPLSRWSRGFSIGYQWLEPTWHDHLPKVGDEQADEDKFETVLGSILVALCFFSSRRMAERLSKETGVELRILAARVHHLLPEATMQYANIARELQLEAVQRAIQGPIPFQRASPKVGRNDPCPCGSGRKHKRCCAG